MSLRPGERLYGSKECVRRECLVRTVLDYDLGESIVVHGDDRFAGSYADLEQAAREYDRWVDFLHRRADCEALRAVATAA